MAGGQSKWTSKIARAIGIGIVLGCVCAFFIPQRFSISNQSIKNWQISKSALRVDSTSCALFDRVVMLKSDDRHLSSPKEKASELKNQVEELKEKLRLATQESGNAEIRNQGSEYSVADVPDARLNPELARILERVAINKELMVTFLNSDVNNDLLEIWLNNVKKIGIPNYLLVALDGATDKLLSAEGAEVYHINSDISSNVTGKAEKDRVLKYRLLIEILQLGYSVLLSDIDIVYLQNPFDYLYRDSDVELMSNGHDNMTAYGYHDDHTLRIAEYSSAFFYIRPTIPSIKLLDRIADRLSQSNVSDQAVLNQELFFPSRPGYNGIHCSKRTMDFYLFMNTKVLFQKVEKDIFLEKHKPVVVHVSDHQDKLSMMKAVVTFYVDGNQAVIDPFTLDYDR